MVVVLSKVRHTGLYRRTQLSLVRYGMSVASGMHNPRVLSWRKKVERGIIDLFEGIEPPRSLRGDRPPKSLRGDLPPKLPFLTGFKPCIKCILCSHRVGL
ncbi:hypothetical protein BHE74_00014232 [Ensete ventricosum]|nr:hypothetical protein BHE74_00014232 [Ensete ventricosum]